MIEARDVTVRVGAASLLTEVSFTADAGELVAVVGPNGAGKSTLLRVLAGDVAPTAGTVHVAGADLTDLPPVERALARSVLTQRARRDVPFTVWEVVRMGRHPHRGSETNSAEQDEAWVRDALRTADVAHLTGRRFSTLSAGEQTRTSLARVLAQRAAVMLLDEPTTALDLRHVVTILQALRAAADDGCCVVAVLHDLNGAARVADRVVAVHEGRIVAEGPPAAVLTADVLTELYGHPLTVTAHPGDGGPLVLPTFGPVGG